MAHPHRIVILISGRGSNMHALVEACSREAWPAQIAAVIANRPDAAGLAWAAERGIAVQAIDHKAYASRDDFDEALAKAIDAHAPTLLLLAGFMRVLGEAFVARYAGRMLNIHPSLLPAFPGLHTHQRAIESGACIAGATVHAVTSELDCGPIIAQAAVPIRHDDTPDTLAARVLSMEHLLYPMAVGWWVNQRLAIEGQRVRQLDGLPQLLMAPAGPNDE